MRFGSRAATMATISLLLLSCSDDGPTPPPIPPRDYPYPTPPVGTMQVDMADLARAAFRALPQDCHQRTRPVVVWASANIVSPLNLPAASLRNAVLRSPAYLGEDTWLWTATGGFGSDARTDRLMGRLGPKGRVLWEMRVTGTRRQLDDFLLFSGGCDTAATEGVWTVFDPASPLVPKEILRIGWLSDLRQGGGVDLAFENRSPDSVDYQDRLHYISGGDESWITLVDRQESFADTTRIYWERFDGSGRLISADRDTCCWSARDSGYADRACPAPRGPISRP